MNIIRLLWNKKMFALGMVMAGLCSGARFALIPKRVHVWCDYKIALDVQKDLKTYLEKVPLRLLGARGVCEELRQVFPVVASLSISYQASLTAQVNIEAVKPRILFISSLPGKMDYVVCANGIVIEKRYFREEVLVGIPTVLLAGADYEHKRSDKVIIDCVLLLKRDVYEQYAITWRSKDEVILQSRLSNSILIADSVTIHEIERLKYAERIAEVDKEYFKKGMRADLRLGDAIVCAPLAGSRYEKTNNI